MATTPNSSVLLPADGIKLPTDQAYYTQVPQQSVAGLKVVKEPAAGSWIGVTFFPKLSGMGYVTAVIDNTITATNTVGTKVRFLIADHPDAG